MKTLFPETISSTMLEDINRCPMLFFRKYCQRLSGETKNPDLLAGGIFASACELTRKRYFQEQWNAHDSIEEGFDFITNAPDIGGKIKTNETTAYAFKRYFRQFPLGSDFKPRRLLDGTYALEYSIELDLGIPHPEIEGKNLIFKAKLDAVYERELPSGKIKIYPVDEKTTEKLSTLPGGIIDTIWEAEKYTTHGQFIAYTYLLEQFLRKEGVEQKIDSFIVRKVPIQEREAIELEIKVTPFMQQTWLNQMIQRVIMLVEAYKQYKIGNFPVERLFLPVYNSNCTAYFKQCKYSAGCQQPDGEEELELIFGQKVYDRETEQVISLDDYLIKLGLNQ